MMRTIPALYIIQKCGSRKNKPQFSECQVSSLQLPVVRWPTGGPGCTTNSSQLAGSPLQEWWARKGGEREREGPTATQLIIKYISQLWLSDSQSSLLGFLPKILLYNLIIFHPNSEYYIFYNKFCYIESEILSTKVSRWTLRTTQFSWLFQFSVFSL